MARRRKKFDIFSMSFLDTICCAFGAIVLLYMILNAAGNKAFKNETVRTARRSGQARGGGAAGFCRPRRAAQQPEDDDDRGRTRRRPVRPRAAGNRKDQGAARRRGQDDDLAPRGDRAAEGRPEADRRREAAARRRHAGARQAGQPGEGVRRHRRSSVPERPQARRRADRHPRRRLGEHAGRNGRQRDPAAQHVGDAPADVAEMAAHRGHGRLADDADSAKVEVPGARVQREGVAGGARQRRHAGSTAAMRRR